MNFLLILVGFLSGVIGAMGLGGGAVLIIYLTLFTENEHLTAAGINLLFFIPIGLLAVIVYSIKRQIKWKTTIKIALFGLIGAAIGLLLTDFLGGRLIGKIFGGLLIIIGLLEIFGKKRKNVENDADTCYTENE